MDDDFYILKLIDLCFVPLPTNHQNDVQLRLYRNKRNLGLIMKQILVVDDVEVCRYTIAIALEDQDIAYKGASSVAEAVDFLKTNKADVIFLDWHIKKEQSTDSLDKIKQLAGPDTIICMMSAIEQDKGQELVAQHEINAFLQKPIQKDQLMGFLKEKAVI